MQNKRNSKDILASSFLELLSTTAFKKLTVQQITDNCGIAKSTFYHNFRDKYELALWCYLHQVERYFDLALSAQSFRGFINYSAKAAWDNRYIIRNVEEYKGQNNFRRSLALPLTQMYLRIIEKAFGDELTDTIQQATAFFVRGTIAYAEAALDLPEFSTAEEAAHVFELGVPACLTKYLDPPCSQTCKTSS